MVLCLATRGIAASRRNAFHWGRTPTGGRLLSTSCASASIWFGALALSEAVLRKRLADLIYVNGPRALPAAMGAGVPVLFHAHSVMTKKYARAIEHFSLRRTRATVLACSQFSARPVQSALGAGTVHVVYNGVDDYGFRARRSAEDPLRVGILGRIAPEKGHLDFLRAAQLLTQDRESVRFVVTGAALFSHSSYEPSVRSLGAACGVEFRGWTDDVAGALHGLDILAVPSASLDASPRVVMEALSAGTCVVAYPSGGIPEVIRSGHSGLLTASRTAPALARSIQTLIRDPGMRIRMAENGRREWQARFTVERFQREVCDRILAAVAWQPGSSGLRSISREPGSARDGARPLREKSRSINAAFQPQTARSADTVR